MLSEVPEGWSHPTQLSIYASNETRKWNEVEALPYIGLEHIEQGTGRLLGFGESQSVTSAKNVFEPGDVLFGKLRPNLRKYWKADRRGICSTDILVLRGKQGLESDYLFAVVQSEPFLAFAENDAAGTKMPRTSWKRLETIELPIPPLNEQHHIAEILSSVDASIQATQAVIEQAERVKRGLMEELLTGGLGSQAIERGEVPEGWAASTFGDEIDFKGGNQPPKSTFVYEPAEGYVRLLQIRDFENDDKAAYIPVNATKVRCNEDDILIARYGASLGRICRGKEGAYNVALVKLILSENLSSDYAFYWLNSNHFQNFLARVGSRSAQAGFNKSDLAPLSLVVPPLEEQKLSSEILASLDDCITKQKTIIEQLARSKRGLMDDLLTGKVRTA